jgi:hypothetical protein
MIYSMALVAFATEFADGTNAIANLLRVVAWPIFALFLILFWRKEIKAILDALPQVIRGAKKVKAGLRGVEIERFSPESIRLDSPPEERPLTMKIQKQSLNQSKVDDRGQPVPIKKLGPKTREG